MDGSRDMPRPSMEMIWGAIQLAGKSQALPAIGQFRAAPQEEAARLSGCRHD